MALASVSINGVTVELVTAKLDAYPKFVQAYISGNSNGLATHGIASQLPTGTAYVSLGGQRGDFKPNPANPDESIDKAELVKCTCDVRVTAASPANAATMRLGFVQNLVSSVRTARYTDGSTMTEQPSAEDTTEGRVFLDSGPEEKRKPWYKLVSPTNYAEKIVYGQAQTPNKDWYDVTGGPFWVELSRLLESSARGAVTLTTTDSPQFAAPLTLGASRHLTMVTCQDRFILYLVLQHGAGPSATYEALASVGWQTNVSFKMKDSPSGLTMQNTKAARTQWAEARKEAKLAKYGSDAGKAKYPLMTDDDWEAHFDFSKSTALFFRLAPQFGVLTERQVTSNGFTYKPANGSIPGMRVTGKTVHDIAQSISHT